MLYGSGIMSVKNGGDMIGNDSKNSMRDYRDLVRRIKSDPNRTVVHPNIERVVNEYTNENPLISVEDRSQANPFPPAEPLILTSPFVKSVTSSKPMMQNLQQAKDKVVPATFPNGTVVNVGLVDIWTEIEQQKKSHPAFASGINLTVEGTFNVLRDMGVDPTAPPPKPKDDSYDDEVEEEPSDPDEPQINWTAQLPPWEQILDNYGAEPVILGLDRCQAYRDAVPPEQRMVGPAGLFSTGTNLFFTLMLFNCLPPPIEDLNSTVDNINATGGRKHKYKPVTIHMRKRFVQWQAPWGKRKCSVLNVERLDD
jgi:hypothetical protein